FCPFPPISDTRHRSSPALVPRTSMVCQRDAPGPFSMRDAVASKWSLVHLDAFHRDEAALTTGPSTTGFVRPTRNFTVRVGTRCFCAVALWGSEHLPSCAIETLNR